MKLSDALRARVISPYNDPMRTDAVSNRRRQDFRILRFLRGVTACVSPSSGFNSGAPLVVLAMGKDSVSGAADPFGSASSTNTSLSRKSLVGFNLPLTEAFFVPELSWKSLSHRNLTYPFMGSLD